MDFMLNLILTFTDNASGNLNKAVGSIEQVNSVANNMSKSLNNIDNNVALTSLAVSADQTGRAFLGMGKTIGGALKGLIGRVISVGSEFESFGVTMEQLYKSEDKVNEQMDKLLTFSATTPFEVEDVKDLLVVLKSQGLEAFDSMKGAQTGLEQETLKWIGDLMAFKPDITAQKWRLAFTNFLGSGAPKVLENALDMGKIAETIGHSIGDTAEERMNSLVEFIEKKDLGGLMAKNMGTWQQTISNLDDTFTKLFRDIADITNDEGPFMKFKVALQNVANALIDLDESDDLKDIANIVGEALLPIADAAILATDAIARMIKGFAKFSKEHPQVVKMAIRLGAVAAVLLLISGYSLVATSRIAFMIQTFKGLGVLLPLISKLGGGMLKFAGIMGLVYLAWHTDFLGIRSLLTDLANNVADAWKYAQDAVSQSAGYMNLQLKLLDENSSMGKLAKNFMKLIVLVRGVADLWSDGEMDANTFYQAQNLGIDELIGRIYDFKVRVEEFFKGFGKGWKEFNKGLKKFFKGVKDGFTDLLDWMEARADTPFGNFVRDLRNLDPLGELEDFFKSISNGDLETWEKWGEKIGKIAPVIITLGGALLFTYKIIKRFKKGGILGGLLGNEEDKDGSILGKKAKGVNKLGGALSNLIKFGVGLVLVGIGIKKIAEAVDLISKADNGILILNNIGFMLGGLMAIAVGFGEKLTEAIPGLLAFGASIVLVGFGIGLLADGIEKIASQDQGIDALTRIGIGLGIILGAAGALAGAGVGLEASVILLALGAGIALIGWGVGKAAEGLSKFTEVVGELAKNDNVADNMWDMAGALTALGGAAIIHGIGGLVDAVGTLFEGFSWGVLAKNASKVADAFTTIGNTTDKVGGWVETFRGDTETFVTDVDTMTTKASDSFSTMADNIESEMTRAVSAVVAGVASLKSAMSFSWKLPHLQVPHITVSGAFNLDPPTAPQFNVRWYAKGGVVDGPTVLGAGEQGKEAIIPLEKNTDWISSVAREFMRYIPIASDENVDSVDSNAMALHPVDTSAPVGGASPAPIVNVPSSGGSTTTTDSRSFDNSVTFNAGAIVIQSNGASDAEAKRMAQKIMQMIARQQQIQNQVNYGINYRAGV